MTIGDIASMIVALATAGSLLYISRQVNVTRKQAKGQFLLALDEQFEKTQAIMMRLMVEPTLKPVGDEWPAVWALMSVFERINIMVEDGILETGLVDRLHGFKLLALIANDEIYGRLAASGAEWKDFIDLCYALAGYREINPGDRNRDAAFIERVHKLNKQTRNTKTPWGF